MVAGENPFGRPGPARRAASGDASLPRRRDRGSGTTDTSTPLATGGALRGRRPCRGAPGRGGGVRRGHSGAVRPARPRARPRSKTGGPARAEHEPSADSRTRGTPALRRAVRLHEALGAGSAVRKKPNFRGVKLMALRCRRGICTRLRGRSEPKLQNLSWQPPEPGATTHGHERASRRPPLACRYPARHLRVVSVCPARGALFGRPQPLYHPERSGRDSRPRRDAR